MGIFTNIINFRNIISEIFSGNEHWQQILLETCKQGLEQLFREYRTNYFILQISKRGQFRNYSFQIS